MEEYELLLHKESQTVSHFAVTKEGLIVGRSSTSDITLDDSMVSRQHARIWLQDDGVYIEDLGSRNGVLLNGRRVWRCCILEGDEITIGEQTLLLRRLAKGGTQEQSVISSEEGDTVLQQMLQQVGSRRMVLLYRAAQLLGTVFDLDELLHQTLDLVADALNVERGYILTRMTTDEAPVIRASTGNAGEDGDAGPPLSQSIISHVFDERDAVLTMNALEDPRFAEADSVIGYSIHAAMCAPLQGRDSLWGVIYVDSGCSASLFSNDELELLTAIGRIVGVAVENASLHREKMTQERLAAVGQATAGIGHAAKNMLTGAKGGGEFIDAGIKDGDWELVQKGRALVRRTLDRLEELVLDLLAYSREEVPQITQTDINELVRETISVLASKAGQAGVELVLNPAPQGRVYLDVRQMYRVLLDLMKNAVEACEEEGGRVEVSVHNTGERCVIEVSDNGSGIPTEMLDRIFQAFVSTKGTRGTGLGLACSQKIVRAHDGEIRVASKVGEGSTFSVHLPMLRSRPTAAAKRDQGWSEEDEAVS